jgi:hypothetical protein
MRELLWAAEGHDEGEWGRLANLMAFIANRLRFSKSDPVIHPRDINPYTTTGRLSGRTSAPPVSMAAFHASHPNMPLETWKQQPDGTWAKV